MSLLWTGADTSSSPRAQDEVQTVSWRDRYQSFEAGLRESISNVNTRVSRYTETVIKPRLQSFSESASDSFDQNVRPVIQSGVEKTTARFFEIANNSVETKKKVVRLIFPHSISSFEEEDFDNLGNRVVLTIDDGPCRGPLDVNLMGEVLDLLDQYDAKCTFFLITDYIDGKEDLVRMILERGHEIANHMPSDISYSSHSAEAFEAELMRADATLNQFVQKPIRVFRPPLARMSKAMRGVLEKHGFISVLGDLFGNDVNCKDPERCARMMYKYAKPGNILVVHMPERGFREWTLREIEETLKGLKAQGLECVSFSQMVATTTQKRDCERSPHLKAIAVGKKIPETNL